ncbi:unnamed protein product [Anisakis simplex]|uniref:Uncharacterized protein n=1 Tax=Anisakis simplex TaxID=6269 RepID=A0A0M3JV79_ANISI|nr:unnamed protein product [Anisakis simplex]
MISGDQMTTNNLGRDNVEEAQALSKRLGTSGGYLNPTATELLTAESSLDAASNCPLLAIVPPQQVLLAKQLCDLTVMLIIMNASFLPTFIFI